jgi:hypothetical protein
LLRNELIKELGRNPGQGKEVSARDKEEQE